MAEVEVISRCLWCYIKGYWCWTVWQQLEWMTCGSVRFYTVGEAVCCWRSCLRPPQSHAGSERGCPWLMSAWLPSYSHPAPQWSPEDSPRLNQPFWPACWVSSCPSLSFHSPSRPQRRRKPMLPQSHKKFLTVSCTHQKTSVSSADGDDFGLCGVCPVQFVVYVNTQVFVLLHNLNVQTLDVHRCSLRSFPPEIDHHLLCFAGINARMVQFTPVDKVGDDLPVLQIVSLHHMCNDGCIVGELVELAAVHVITESDV